LFDLLTLMAPRSFQELLYEGVNVDVIHADRPQGKRHPHSGKNAALAYPIGSVSDVRTKHEKAGID
jgi:hypothetical protein